MPSMEEERVRIVCSHRLALPPRRAIWIRETNPNYSTDWLGKLLKTLTFIFTCLYRHFVTVNVVEGKVFNHLPN